MGNKKIGVMVFPGSNCDRDCFHVFNNVYQQPTTMLWHANEFNEKDYDLLILPGGFSYGDYLRTGAIARFAKSMNSLIRFASQDRPILGICNGFQILCEAGLLPGALVMNRDLLFKCHTTPLQGEDPASPYLMGLKRKKFHLPIAHGEGSYFIDALGYEKLKNNRQIIITYLDNPNGSYKAVAGITNIKGNIIGMMPHPERASEELMGSSDGKIILDSILQAI